MHSSAPPLGEIQDCLAKTQSKRDPLTELELRAFGSVVYFLKQAMLEARLPLLKICQLMPNSRTHLMLDAQALDSLDIMSKGGLFSYINFCQTEFGTRQLQRWLLSPSTSLSKIAKRQEAITFFVE